MGNISIRGISSEINNLLKEKALKEGMSLNSYLLKTLKEHVGLSKKLFTKTYNDLDDLVGIWSKEEFDSITKSIDSGRQIDEEMWK